MPYLDRDVADKIFELVGEYSTEARSGWEGFNSFEHDRVPMPNFGETIRILPNIGEKKGWERDEVTNKISMRRVSHILAEIYMLAPSAEEGMTNVSEYLRKIL